MICHVSTHFLPDHVQPEELAGGVAVVIDVLRATTTIVRALSEGATAVIPCGEIEAARALAGTYPPSTVLLGGERGGQPIAGFDLGNAPVEYSRDRVEGKTVVLTTTNGTRALLRAQTAERVLVAAFANLTAVVAALANERRSIHLVCSGSEGELSLEDLLLAGAISSRLVARRGDIRLSETSLVARTLFEGSGRLEGDRLALFRSARGGQTLLRIGREEDLLWAAQCDTSTVVPERSGTAIVAAVK